MLSVDESELSCSESELLTLFSDGEQHDWSSSYKSYESELSCSESEVLTHFREGKQQDWASSYKR